MKKPAPPRGMTLLELMTVVMLFGLMASLAVMNWTTFTNRQKKQGAVKEIFQAMVRARQLAIVGNAPVRLKRQTLAQNGKTYDRVRWEKLACGDTWGITCPLAACAANACGVGGCVCVDVGPDIDLPPLAELQVATLLDGLCFTAGSGVPVKNTAGMCAAPVPATNGVAPTDLRFQFPIQGVSSASGDAYIVLDPTTGWPVLTSCDAVPKPFPCP